MYYELDWHAHREQSLERAKGDGIQWGSGAPWVVAVEPVLKYQRRALERVEEGVDTRSGTGSDGEYTTTEPPSVGTVTNLLFSDNATPAEVPQTPSKKRKQTTSTASTPRRRRGAPALAVPTPHSKRALRARARLPTVRAPPPEMAGTFSHSEASTETDAWLRAMHALHVGARPEALPCRAEEYARVMRVVEELIEEGSGGCICELLLPLLVVIDEIVN